MNTTVYADYAAASPTDDRVIAAMLPYHNQTFANPSSAHSFGSAAAKALGAARAATAKFLNADTEEIYFTSSGTESNNIAILGSARANRNNGRHIITTTIEHPSILNACRTLERDGFAVTYVNVDKSGVIRQSDVVDAVTNKTILVTLHLANSEIGVIQPIAELVKKIKAKNPRTLIHTDGCQATTFLDLNVRQLGIDLLTLNGSKVYGPRGVATLFVRSGVSIFPILYGGGQEKSLRSGTENLPGIVGFAAAVKIAQNQRDRDARQIGKLRDRLQAELEKIDGVIINCHDSRRLPNHLSVTLTKTQSTDLVRDLDRAGIAVSSGSACSSHSLTESHVLLALGLSSELINKTIRITLGRPTSLQDCHKTIRAIQRIA